MRTNLFFARISFIIAIPLLLISCGESTPEENQLDIIDTHETIVKVAPEDMEPVEDDYQFIPPSPLQVASIFKKAGLDYDEGLLCRLDNLEDYTTKFEQTLVFGAFSSDLSYCVKNEEYYRASDCLKALREVGEKIGLETIFNSEDLINRFEKNIENQDSLVDLLIFIQENTDEYIEENGKDELSVVYYTGAWIEGMYLGAKTVMEKENQKVGLLISEQMTIAEILHNGLTHIQEQNEDIIELTGEVKDIIDSFYKLESVMDVGEEIDYIDVELTSDELALISEKIVNLREGFVSK